MGFTLPGLTISDDRLGLFTEVSLTSNDPTDPIRPKHCHKPGLSAGRDLLTTVDGQNPA